MTALERNRREDVAANESEWYRTCLKVTAAVAFVIVAFVVGVVIGLGKNLTNAEVLLHAEMKEQWKQCKAGQTCIVGPFKFQRANPYLHAVEIAGAGADVPVRKGR